LEQAAKTKKQKAMKSNWKERLTFAKAKEEFSNSFWVAAGLLGASVVDRLVDKGVEKFVPSAKEYVGYIKAAAQIATGVVVSSLADKESEKQKLIGYGIAGSGFLSGIRMIPAVDQLFSGLGTTQSPAFETIDLGLVGMSGTQAVYGLEQAKRYAVDLQDPPQSGTNYQPTYSDNGFNEVEVEELTAEFI
jgi:hypothetical protein